MKRIIFILLSIISIGARSQGLNTITGAVADEKGEALPGATVFITNTRYNTATNADGKFSFSGLEAGNYEIVVKMIGYLPYISELILAEKPVTLTITLKENNVLLNTVTVKATDPNREEHLKTFIKYFIGESANAVRCTITNPQVLNLHYDKNTDILEASSDKFLMIENDGLGYRLNYLLTDFKYDARNLILSYTGHPYFEDLKGSAAQQNRWEKNRQAAYLGSANHFFRSVFNHTAEAEGFLIYPLTDKVARMKLPPVDPVPADQLFAAASHNTRMLKPEYNQISSEDTTALFIFYKNGFEPRSFVTSGTYVQSPVKLPGHGQLSKIEPIAGKIQIDKNGALIPEKSFLMSGYWIWGKIAEMLPEDYGQTPQGQVQRPLQAETTINNTNTLDDLIGHYKQYAAYHAIEKIYLQLNKPWYNRADTIWFKAYTVTGDHKPTDISRVAYVELISPKDSIIDRVKLKLHNGTAAADFTLPITLTPGTYRIRAYTNWMRNHNQYFDDRRINIGGIPQTTNTTSTTSPTLITTPTPTPTQPTDIQFFPEGGTMMNGVHNRVAFKATNPDGNAANVTGTIAASDGTTVATLKSGHAGMGSFEFIPQEGKTYSAELMVNSQGKQTIGLPVALTKGLSLAVHSKTNDTVIITVAANPQQLADKAGADFEIMATMGDKIVYTYAGTAATTYTNCYINKKALPSGILRLTLFSATGEPLNERVVFIRNNDNLALDIKADKNSYHPHDKISLSVSAQNPVGKPVFSELSAAVINESLAPTDEAAEPTILSQLLLSSELHGTIADPGYYFKNNEDKTLADLDLLMLTQGFRKLEWKQRLDTTKQPTYIAEDGLSISGTVKTLDGQPVARSKVSLFMPKQKIAVDTLTDANGHFDFGGLDITGNSPVMIKATKSKTSNNADVNVFLDPPGPGVNAPPVYTIITDQTPSPVIAAMQKTYTQQEQEYPLTGARGKARLLKEVTIKQRQLEKPDLSTSANLHGGGQANQVIMGKDLAACVKLSECLASKLIACTVYPDGEIVYIGRGIKTFDYVKHKDPEDPNAPTPSSPPMAIFVDGAEINSTMLNYINAADVYSIEVLTSVSYTSIYGQDGYGGVLLITTKRGGNFDVSKVKRAPGIINYLFNGYDKERTFYTPKYNAANTAIQDDRAAIYWKPDLVTDNEGKATLEFRNAGKGNYRVVVEGIDDDGHIGRYVYRYKVD
jgi:hypothetical protein